VCAMPDSVSGIWRFTSLASRTIFRNPLITNERILNPVMDRWLHMASWEERSCYDQRFAVFCRQ
jgi:hypothetical protein